MKLEIRNAVILTMDEPEVVRGNIGIEDDRIVYIGKDDSFAADEIVDAKGGIVMPGLINTHTHVPMTFLRNAADDMTLHDWLFNKVFPAEDKLNGETVRLGTLVSCAEMIRFGTTAFADMYFFMDDIAEAAIESGMRAHLSRSLTSDESSDPETDFRLKEAAETYEKYHGANDGKISIDHSIHAVYTNTIPYLKWCAEHFAKDGRLLQVHLSETKKEQEDCLRLHGKTPAALLRDCGFFRTPTLAAHCVWLTEEDQEILRDNNVSIAHCPVSNLKLASGVMPQYEGINIALGTDSNVSNNNLDLFEEMKFAALLPKGLTGDPTKVPAREAIRFATVNAAKALGMTDVGRLKPGYLADLIILDADAPNLTPLHDPFSAVVYAANGGDVTHTMCGGKWLMKDRVLQTIDWEKLREQRKDLGSAQGVS